MSDRIRCPECESTDVECVEPPHDHLCRTCGYSTLPPTQADLEAALLDIADWVVHVLGIPHDMGTELPPPRLLRHAIYRIVHEDRTGGLHGNELTFPVTVAWINEESRWGEFTSEYTRADLPEDQDPSRERPGERGHAMSWWLCPNDPPCPHGAIVHDVEDYEDPSPTCCVEGCPCGHSAPAADVGEQAPREGA